MRWDQKLHLFFPKQLSKDLWFTGNYGPRLEDKKNGKPLFYIIPQPGTFYGPYYLKKIISLVESGIVKEDWLIQNTSDNDFKSFKIRDAVGQSFADIRSRIFDYSFEFPKRKYVFPVIGDLEENVAIEFMQYLTPNSPFQLKVDKLGTINSTISEMFPNNNFENPPVITPNISSENPLWYFRISRAEIVGPCMKDDMIRYYNFKIINDDTLIRSAYEIAPFVTVKVQFTGKSNSFLY